MPPLCDGAVDGDDGDGEQGACPGPLRCDHAVHCGCGCGGISSKSMRRAAPPRTRPATSAYRPDPSLESFLLPRGKEDRALLEAALAEAKVSESTDA